MHPGQADQQVADSLAYSPPLRLIATETTAQAKGTAGGPYSDTLMRQGSYGYLLWLG
jgi:hypothetical protein